MFDIEKLSCVVSVLLAIFLSNFPQYKYFDSAMGNMCLGHGYSSQWSEMNE